MPEKNTVSTLKFKLNSLLEITRAINDNQPIDALLDNYVNILRDQLKIGKVIMFKYNDGWECILSAGISKDVVNGINVKDMLLSYDEITFISSELDKLPDIDIVIPVYNNNKAIAYVLIGDIEEEMEGVSPVIKHLHFIQTISNIIVVAIENIRLFKESLQREALRKELELASQMQNMLVPSSNSLPSNKCMKMRSFYKPHHEVGGDYFDYIDLGDKKIGFCVADVSGKGMAAALMMSNFQATLRALFTAEISMDSLMQKMNRRVYESAQGDKFITIFIARYDCVKHQLEYANAGHTPTILYNIGSKSMELLKSASLGLGMNDILPVTNVKTLTITEDCLMLSYTDGLVELLSDTDDGCVKEAYDVLENAVQNASDIDVVIQKVIDAQNLQGKNQAVFDDVTFLGVKFFA